MAQQASKQEVRAYVAKVKKNKVIVVADERTEILNRSAFHGRAGADGVNAYGTESYPKAGGGWTVSDRDKDFIKQKADEQRRDKEREKQEDEARRQEALAAQQTGQTKQPGRHEQTQEEYNAWAERQLEDAKREKQQHQPDHHATQPIPPPKQAVAQPPQPAKPSGAKISLKDLTQFSPRMLEFLETLKKAEAVNPKAPEVIAAKSQLEQAFRGAYKVAEKLVAEFPGTIADLKNNATWMSPAPDTKDVEHEIQTGAKSMGNSARALDAGDHLKAWVEYILGYQDFSLATSFLDILTASQIKSADSMVTNLHNIEDASVILLAVLSGGLEAGLTKVAFAALPAATMATEKFVAETFYKLNYEVSYLQIGVKGVLDLLFAGLGVGLDKTVFSSLENRLFAKVLMFDVATQKTLLQLTPLAKTFLVKEVTSLFLAWIKANADKIAEEYFAAHKSEKDKAQSAAASILESAWTDFTKDQSGAAFVSAVREALKLALRH